LCNFNRISGISFLVLNLYNTEKMKKSVLLLVLLVSFFVGLHAQSRDELQKRVATQGTRPPQDLYNLYTDKLTYAFKANQWKDEILSIKSITVRPINDPSDWFYYISITTKNCSKPFYMVYNIYMNNIGEAFEFDPPDPPEFKKYVDALTAKTFLERDTEEAKKHYADASKNMDDWYTESSTTFFKQKIDTIQNNYVNKKLGLKLSNSEYHQKINSILASYPELDTLLPQIYYAVYKAASVKPINDKINDFNNNLKSFFDKQREPYIKIYLKNPDLEGSEATDMFRLQEKTSIIPKYEEVMKELSVIIDSVAISIMNKVSVAPIQTGQLELESSLDLIKIEFLLFGISLDSIKIKFPSFKYKIISHDMINDEYLFSYGTDALYNMVKRYSPYSFEPPTLVYKIIMEKYEAEYFFFFDKNSQNQICYSIIIRPLIENDLNKYIQYYNERYEKIIPEWQDPNKKPIMKWKTSIKEKMYNIELVYPQNNKFDKGNHPYFIWQKI
jgi:hypothetical protein